MKQKTPKAVSKKIRLTKKGKVMRRGTGHNHNNAKETGKERRGKRKDLRLFAADEKNIKKALR